MKPQQTRLTLRVEPQDQASDWGPSDNGLRYPPAAALHLRTKGLHGTPADRLAQAYSVEPSGCWRWLKGRTTVGYGHFSIRGIYYQAHVLTYILHRGTPPIGLQPDHLCRNRWCVNPDHIEFVTRLENVRRGAQTKLTPGEVEMIRAEFASGISQRAIGRARGIDHSTVSRIISRKRWADVGERTVAA